MALTQVSSNGIKDATLLNADVNANAAIAKSKIENLINNNADNRLITGSGTANTLNGESGLTFDGSTINFTAASGDARLSLFGTEGNNARITLCADEGDDHIDQYNIESRANNSFVIDQFESGSRVDRFIIANGGNVGIGVTPTIAAGGGLHIRGPHGNQSRLHLTTNRSGDGAGDGFYIIQQGDESSNNETNFINYETASMKFSTSGVERLRIHSTGVVGIGTSTPAAKLHVSGGDGLLVERSSGSSIAGFKHTGATAMNIYFQNTGSTNHPYIGSSNQDLVIGTNNIERLRVLSGGGLTFNGDTAGSNALTDYEEGTYTPADASGQSISFSNVVGFYTKIGGLVHVQGSVTFPGTGGQYGFSITLPFTATSNGRNAGGGDVRYTTKTTAFNLHVNANAASFSGYSFGGTQQRNVDLSTDRLDFQLTYRVG